MGDNFHAQCAQHRFDGNRLGLGAHQDNARARMRLGSGHRRGGSVQYAYGDVVLVVHRIGNARHAAGKEGGIAYERKSLLTRLYHAKALCHCNARAHAQARVDSVQGLCIAQRIAADIAAENAVAWLLQRGLHRVECATMWATWT